jgi:hypothetical protein
MQRPIVGLVPTHKAQVWVDALDPWLPLQNPAYRKLIEYGVSQERGVTVTLNIEHSHDLYMRNITKGTFENPSVMNAINLKVQRRKPLAQRLRGGGRNCNICITINTRRTVQSTAETSRTSRAWQL